MTPKLLGIPTQLITRPLTRTLRDDAQFQLVEDSRPNIAKQLQQQELSAALLSPLDYAKDSSDYCIVPTVAVKSNAGGAIIRFREGLQTIRSLAVDPTFACEIILAKIILAESFDLEPKVLPMIASIDEMLKKADAALLVGDAAFRLRHETEDAIDLVEEWNEMTELPFVHALWCGRENDLTKEEIAAIQSAATNGVAQIADISQEFPSDNHDATRQYLESFSYELNDEAKEALTEFLKFMYFHGIFPDVAELNFFPTDDEKEDDLLSDISAN